MLNEAEVRIEAMEYRPLGTMGLGGFPAAPCAAGEPGVAARIGELETRLEATQRERDAARRAGVAEGRQEVERERVQLLAQTAASFNRAVAAFSGQRDAYFGEVEQEVVHLALAIAERILRRETQMDPLLLSGAVRVALNQLGDGTAVRLRIPAEEAAMWRDFLKLCPNLALEPQMIEDDTLSAGECQIETHLGTVDLGVRAQLVEIERGFFDILERRAETEEPARKGSARP